VPVQAVPLGENDVVQVEVPLQVRMVHSSLAQTMGVPAQAPLALQVSP